MIYEKNRVHGARTGSNEMRSLSRVVNTGQTITMVDRVESHEFSRQVADVHMVMKSTNSEELGGRRGTVRYKRKEIERARVSRRRKRKDGRKDKEGMKIGKE